MNLRKIIDLTIPLSFMLWLTYEILSQHNDLRDLETKYVTMLDCLQAALFMWFCSGMGFLMGRNIYKPHKCELPESYDNL